MARDFKTRIVLIAYRSTVLYAFRCFIKAANQTDIIGRRRYKNYAILATQWRYANNKHE